MHPAASRSSNLPPSAIVFPYWFSLLRSTCLCVASDCQLSLNNTRALDSTTKKIYCCGADADADADAGAGAGADAGAGACACAGAGAGAGAVQTAPQAGAFTRSL